MVRTGDRCVRIGGGKSSGKKGGGSTSSSSTPKSKASSSKSNSSIGGNPVCPRETPGWQKPITNFFQRKDVVESSNHTSEEEAEASGTSKNTVACNSNTFDKMEENAEGTSCENNHTVTGLNNSPTEIKIQDNRLDSHESKTTPVIIDRGDEAIPSTSASNERIDHNNGNEDKCKTPTSDRKRKSAINILTPKRIQSHS